MMRRLLNRQALLAAAAMVALPVASVFAGPVNFDGTLTPLNNSGVTGSFHGSLNSDTLSISIDASGLQPNEPHPQHIHGINADGSGNASVPTLAQDTNGDGFISVFEGAATYGRIKVNFTDPPTPPGPNTNTTLFFPFAGTPDAANFPTAPDGNVHYSGTLTFNPGNADDAAALASIQPLFNQEIVLHGMDAPETVDGFGTDPNHVIYDPLLPIAAGEIRSAATAVPLPAAFWPGLGMLGILGAFGMTRKRRSALA